MLKNINLLDCDLHKKALRFQRVVKPASVINVSA